MRAQNLHAWDVTPQDAMAIQLDLAQRIVTESSLDLSQVKRIAGADIALDAERNEGYAGVIVYSYPELEPLEYVSSTQPLTFPYIPGLLTFREGPVMLNAFAQVTQEPDIVIFDGHGIAHPRGIGIASHMGLLLDKPTIGCAKSRLCGEYEEPGMDPGNWASLSLWEHPVGLVLRTKRNTTPVYVSPGHKMDFDTALRLVLKCLDGFRIPRPTREADQYVAALKSGRPFPPPTRAAKQLVFK